MSLRGESYVRRLERRTAFWLAAFTALTGALLGVLADIVPGVGVASGGVRTIASCLVRTGCDPAAQDVALRTWVSALLLLLSSGAGVVAWRQWRRRNALLSQRGTVYVVDSPAKGWTPDEKQAFLDQAEKEAAAVVRVPGPTGLTTWDWPLAEGADRWSDAVDDLVLSFRSVWANDDRRTPDSVVCWAPYPVAVAWTARAYAAQRNLGLSFRQRPSSGRAGPIAVPDWGQVVHTYDGADPATGVGTISPVRAARISIVSGGGTAAAAERPRVLLVRLHGRAWANVSLDGDDPVDLTMANRSGQPLGIAAEGEFHEWRHLLAPGRMHPWQSYPALVDEICSWIARTAHDTGPNLIGLLAPQEVQLGIGVNVSRREPGDWPQHLWPLVTFSSDQVLTVPGLDLGFDSLHLHHRDAPR